MESEQKACRHCTSLIPQKARRCVHCHSFQGWLAAQADPRFFAVFFGGFMLLFVITITASLWSAARHGIDDEQITVRSYHIVQEQGRNILYALLSVKCPDGSCRSRGALFQVDVHRKDNAVIDTLQACHKLVIAKDDREIAVRVSGTLVVAPEDIESLSAKTSPSGPGCRQDGG